MAKHQVTLIPGDGVGPEVALAARRIVDASGAQIEWEECAAGASVFKLGVPTGVPKETLDSIQRTRMVLKGPLETPVGYGEKSANVTLRKLFETYANIRPIREFPGVPTPYSGRGIDLVVVRENVEDLYAGIEHMQTPTVAQCLKLISRLGCEKITRLAFEFARSEGRTRVSCATKANIMKMTEGLLKRTFEEIAPDYPDIEASHIIVDNAAHQLVKRPEQFDVIVTTNMNGDILSDLTSALVGGLGFAPSANLGDDIAIFEAVHGSAPKYAGQNVINPTALILSAVMMLRRLGEFEAAAAIEGAVLVTMADGKHRTRDIVGDNGAASTTNYTDAIIANLGRTPEGMAIRERTPIAPIAVGPKASAQPSTRRLAGADIFVESDLGPALLGPSLEALTAAAPLRLKMLSNRGTMVYPATGTGPDCVNHYRCRFVARSADTELTDADILSTVTLISAEHRWMHIEKLQEFDGAMAYTRAQGED